MAGVHRYIPSWGVMTGLPGLTRLLRSPLLGLLLGLVAFVLLFDVHQVDPTYLDWQLGGDAAQHHIGWEFFRYEPWRLPLGKITGFGTPDGTSIVFTDSIPILALIFKAFRALLPERFQYVGLWLLGCYALQGVFGWLLSTLATVRIYPRVLITCFFLLSPILIDRNQQGHHALMAHWLILAAIYLAFQSEGQFEARHPRLSWWLCWTVLVVLSGMIHLYIAAMIVPIYLAAGVSSLRSTRLRPVRALMAMGSTLAVFLLALYLEGAFVLSSEHWADKTMVGFGHFSMNLLSPLSPGYWSNKQDSAYMSVFLEPHHDYTGGQYEGFNYLGVGVLGVLGVVIVGGLISTFLYVRGISVRKPAEPAIKAPVLVIVALVLLMGFALSHRMAIGTHLLAYVRLSPKMLERCEAFRSSGRFFWPCYYAILLFAFRGLATLAWLGRGAMPILLHTALTIQAVDLSEFMSRNAKQNRESRVFHNTLSSPTWHKYVRECDNIKYYPPGDIQLYVPLGLIAAPKRVGINVAYKARRNQESLKRAEQQTKQELERGELLPRTLYVFNDAHLYSRLKESARRNELVLDTLNGYHVALRLEH